MDGTTVTYRQQKSFCSKSGCRKCREGIGHGPYWYAYQVVNGRNVRTYIGKTLPADVRPEQIARSSSSLPAATEESSMPLLRLTTLGQIRLERCLADGNKQTVTETGWRLPQARLLLACLAYAPKRQATTQQISAWLWPELAAKEAGQSLRRASAALELTLGPGYLKQEHTLLTLAGQTRLWVDGTAFEQTLSRAHALPARHKNARIALLLEAIKLYGGAFLPEEPAAGWAGTQRERLHSLWLGAMLTLVDLYVETQLSTPAIELLEQLLAANPAHEAASQRLMFVLARQQRRVEAMQVFQRLSTILHTMSQASPTPDTQSLAQAIEQGHEILFKPLSLTAALRELAATRSEGEQAESRSTEQAAFDVGKGVEHAQSAEAAEEAELMSSEFSIGHKKQSPLVGRHREMAILHQLLAQVGPEYSLNGDNQGLKQSPQPRSRCLVLKGEAGIGKTRLAEESAREAQRRGWNVIWSRAYRQEQGIYRLWTMILRNVLTNTPELLQQIAASASAATYQPLLILVPDILEKLGLKSSPEPQAYEALSPSQEEQRLRDAIYAFLSALSSRSPLLLILDDVQWTDESSAQMFGYFARHMAEHPIALLATCRESELAINRSLHNMIQEMQREHAVDILAVQPLSDDHIGKLVSYLPPSAIAHVQSQAAGNPFFAEELGYSLSTNDLPATPLQLEGQEETQALPSTIAAALNQRLNRLSKECQDLLDKAAVLGGSFDMHLISVIETGGATNDDEAVIDLLEEALLSGALREDGDTANATYRLWHPLLSSHLYARLTKTKRVRLHRRIADSLRQIYASNESAEAATIVRHLALGGAEPALIAQYDEMAGQHAYNLFAYSDATRYYRLVLQTLAPTLLDPLPDDDTPLLPAASPQERLHLSLICERLAECARILGNFKDAPHFFLCALRLRSWPERTFATPAEARLEAQIQAMLWSEIAWIWRYTGDTPAALACNERGRETLQKAAIVGGPAWASLYHQRASLYWHEGYPEKALQAAEEALELFSSVSQTEEALTIPPDEQTRVRRSLLGDPINTGRAHNLLSIIYMVTGQLSKSITHLQQALEINNQHDRRRESANVYCNIGHIHLLQGEYAQAETYFQRALAYAEESEDIPIKSVALYNMGELACIRGQFEYAEKCYLDSLDLAARMNDREYLSNWHAFLGTMYQEWGKFKEAETAILHALSIARSMSNQPCIGIALIALANLRLALVEHDQAATNAQRTDALSQAAADLEHALKLRGLDAETRTRAHLASAQLSRLRGDLGLAREQAQEVCKLAQQYELKVLQKRCQRLLASLLEAEEH